MMTNLLNGAHVANNLLNVLQGYSKTIRLLLVMFLTLTVSANAWGADETATFIASSYGWNDGAKTGDPTTKTVDDITFKFAGGSTEPTYYDANGLRTYEGCQITISSEATISSIAFAYTNSNNGSLSATPGTWNSSTKKWSGSANTVTFTVGHSSGTKNGQIRITQIAVTYAVAAASDPFTVTLDAGPGTCAASVTEASAGAGVTLPTPTLDGCGEWTFAGWKTTSAVTTETTTEPTLIPAGAYSPTSDITLYAVYQRTEESAGGGSTEEEVSFSDQGYTNQQEVSSYDGTNFSVAFDKGSNSNTPKYYTSGTAIRIYGGGYFTVSSNATITKIVLGFGSSDGSNAITTNVDTYSNGTWTGSANSVKFTIGGSSGNRRIASLTVTTSGGGYTTYYHSTPECGSTEPSKLATPTELNVTNITSTSATLSWGTVENAENYAIIIKKGDEKVKDITAGGTICNVTELAAGTEYTWCVYAVADGYADSEEACSSFETTEPLTDNCRWVEIPIEDITPEDEIVVTMGDDEIGYALGTETINPSPKSQAITITSGMIDTNQDFEYSKYTWSISAVTGGYTLQPYGTTDIYLYGVKSYISIGNNNTNNVFTIFTSPENGNKCFMYTIEYKPYYLGHGTENEQTAWKRVESSNFLNSNTLKFYKKTCLPADEYWIIYNLENVTCTTDPIPSQIANDGEDLLLEFSANDGYKLPETISVKMGETEIGNDENYCVWGKETGALLIAAEQITDNITITIEGCERLAAPENLLATNITSTSAVLSWDAVAKADEYIVFVTDGETNLEIPTTNCTITIEGLSKNTYYLWDVTATADNYCDSKKPSVLTNEFTTLDVHTVTFNSDGGTDVAHQNVDHGTKATKPANPTKTGYTFVGWYTEADTEFNFNTPIESATTLYAKWNANQYTITFRQQWGNGGTETATVHFNNNDFSDSPITVPTRDGYTFGGYYTETGGAGTQLIDVSGAWLNAPTYIEGGKWVYADDLTLYAKWTQNFTITWMANGQLYHTQTAMMGTAIAKPDDPDANELACDDKVFVGWLDKTISGSTNEEPTFVTDFGTIQANKTYYAVFATVTGTPSNDYNKITDINDLTDGKYVIAYSYDGGTQIVLNNTTKDATKMNASALAPSSNKYTSPNAEYIWQLQKQDDGSYYMYNSSVNKFLYATTSALQLSDNPTKYTISYDNNYSHWKIKLSNNTSYYMHGYVSGSSYDFRVSTSGSGNNYRVYLYKNASTAVYSDYVTTCVEIPTPHWEGAEIDNADIAVDCGAISFKSNASKITFDKNYDLTYSITLTASEGFWLSTNQQKDVYEQSVTVTPVQSGDNKGKITQPVYVRADATGKKTNFDGTITISGDQLAEDQIIEVHAIVDCPQYTLTFNDGEDTKTITDFAGTSVEEMEPWAETCSEPFQYVFDGWATEPVTNGTEGYEKVDFSTFTMPNNNTTILYAVYRYAEEGGEPVNGYVKVTEALADWSGDYVIVDDENLFAIKNAYRENTNSNKTLAGETVTIENDKVVSPSANIVWSFSKNGNGYTMYNVATDIYAGIGTHSRAAVLSEIIADENNIKIIFDDAKDIAKVSGIKNNRCFQYYVTNDEIKEWRTYDSDDSRYNTGYLYRLSNKTIRYTSSLVCGTIEAEDAIVTSTVGQTVKVYVPITLEYSDVASITGTSDNEAFTVVTKNDVAVGESNIEVHYKPTAYVNTANQKETATITLTTSKGATTTFNVTGRCLPETFAIVAKVGNIWYALPSQGLNSTTPPAAYPIEVDNQNDPTAVVSVPANADWSLRQVYASSGANDRFAANGENLVFVNAENKTLYASKDNANIQTYAEYSKYATTNPDRYEWVPTTTDLTNYTLKNVGRDKDLSINVNATFGTHASNIASNNLRFLPINATYNPFDMQVVEWYPTKVLVQTEAALTSVSATVGGVAFANPDVTKMGGKLYEISGLPLESNPTKVLTISYDSYSCSKVIPIIISREDKTVEDAPFSTLTKDIYNYSDLVVRDGAVLNITGAKNTPDKFVNVTIYPTAKIVVPENNQLSVYTLTFFGGIDDIYDGEKYTTNKYGVPQLSLKGTLGKTVTTMDYIMRVDLEQMYQMGVPYDVNLGEITYWDGTSIELGSQLYVSAYDGQARANRESKTWIWETDFEEKLGSSTLKPGIGYTISAEPQVAGDTYSILRMPMKNNIASGNTEEEKSVMVVAYDNQKDVTITDNHKGWNYLSNPYMAAISGAEADSKLVVGYLRETGTGPWEWVDDTYRYVTIPHNDGEDYYQQKFSDATLLPFKSFFLQIETDGKLSFALASRQALPARLLQQENAPREVEFEILLANDTRSDNMGLLIGEDYTPAYEINADLEKMIGSMSVYTIYNGYNLAYNALSPINAQEQIPIGYVVPDVGEYTFKLDENADVENIEHIYLNDLDMNVITDLLEDEYTFYASEKKNEARFVINVIMRSEQEDDTPTRLEELDINTNHAIKFFYQDKLYILRNGIIYDAMGKQVQTINK